MFRLMLKLLLPLVAILSLLAYLVLPLVDRLTVHWYKRDLDRQASLVATAMADLLPKLLTESTPKDKIERLFNRAVQDERLMGLAYCDGGHKLIASTSTFPPEIHCDTAFSAIEGKTVDLDRASFHVSAVPLDIRRPSAGYLVLVHDLSFVHRRSSDTKLYLFYLFLLVNLAVAIVTLVVARISWRDWLSGLRTLVKTAFEKNPKHRLAPELRPLLKDIRSLIRDLESPRRVRDDSQISWSPQALKNILKQDLARDEILLVSNREPYLHVRRGDKVDVQFPASGLVTALEPLLRACSGTWIAHGSGNADREFVDKKDHISVPPDSPSYQLRRVWLTEEQEKGYYYGFSNEGLWPLCHIAHVRPVFRASDWKAYQEVNELFAKAVVEEAKTEDPVVLIQDYHFALLPKLVRERLPKATIVTFWHIPWPNAEAFGICPWRQELLEGLLGSSVMAFHTRFHCNNFLESVDRFLECRIDRETSQISYSGKLTSIRAYPISIEWPPKVLSKQETVQKCREAVMKRFSLPEGSKIGIGIDRLDYTKGILERLTAVERFLELFPEWIGKFYFIQISAPSRAQIERYQQFHREVVETVDRINARYQDKGYQPIHLITEHHEPKEVYEYLRAADVCMVTSLHDGMNLVAKEFVAAREDEQGVLVLSMFTGASRELPESLIVNPYNMEQCAEALHQALLMTPTEQRDRMRSMRRQIQELNVFRWAGKMLTDAAALRYRNRLMEKTGNAPLG